MESPFPQPSSVPGVGRVVAKLLPSGISGLETATYQYPLKLVAPSRPFETKSVLVFLLSYGGGLVGGDSITLSIRVLEEARLSIVTQGNTKIFKSASRDVVTRQALDVEISDGGALCLLPDPVQPFEDSVYEQTQIFRMAERASLCLLDWLSRGRSARGENWDFLRWTGKNEVWQAREGDTQRDRLLVRDNVILDADQSHDRASGKSLRDTMHGMGVFGTMILRGPLVEALGEFFLAEFAALPRLGARDFRSAETREREEAARSPLEKWRSGRIKMEQAGQLLWSAANVRGCVVVKFGAPDVAIGRTWIRSMMAWEGSISSVFGDQALMCVR